MSTKMQKIVCDVESAQRDMILDTYKSDVYDLTQLLNMFTNRLNSTCLVCLEPTERSTINTNCCFILFHTRCLSEYILSWTHPEDAVPCINCRDNLLVTPYWENDFTEVGNIYRPTDHDVYFEPIYKARLFS